MSEEHNISLEEFELFAANFKWIWLSFFYIILIYNNTCKYEQYGG